MTLDDKVRQAVKLLQVFGKGKVVEVSYSGGKDSDVILELAKMAGIEFRAIYKNTTIDPPYTHKHCRNNGVEILKPSMRFLDIVKKSGFPTRRARFCCGVMKEYKVMDNAVQGIRRSESTARAKRYQEPIICRLYGNNKKNHVNVCLPILEWTDKDVERFIELRGIKCHPLYYDEQGKFHVERRLGCIGCPLQSDQGEKDFLEYPKMLKAWLRAGKVWWETHPNANSHKKFKDVYELMYHNIFCDSYEDFLKREQPDLWGGQLDCKKYLEDYFKIDLNL